MDVMSKRRPGGREISSPRAASSLASHSDLLAVPQREYWNRRMSSLIVVSMLQYTHFIPNILQSLLDIRLCLALILLDQHRSNQLVDLILAGQGLELL